MGGAESNSAQVAKIGIVLLSSAISILALVSVQRCVLAQVGHMTERAITVSVGEGSPAPRLSPQKVLDAVSPVSPYASPVLEQNDIYAVSADGHLVRRDVLTGQNRWRSAGATPFSDVVASQDRLYAIETDATVVARDKKSGALLWSRRVSDAGNLRLTMIRGMLFVQGDYVTRLSPDAGAVLWQAQTGRVSKLVAPASVFASTAAGEPIQESIAVINSASGKILAVYNPGSPVGIAQIVGIRGDAVLVHASATATTINEDGDALTRIVWLDSKTGQLVKNWPYRPDATSHGPDTGIANPIVDGGYVAFQTGDSIYRYDLETAPVSQRPYRLQGIGNLIAFRGDQMYTQTEDGLYGIRFAGERAIRRHLLAYHYDASLNRPAPVQTEDTIAVSDGQTIQVLDLVTNKARRYSATCAELFGVFRSGNLVALQCENAAAKQGGVIYVVRLASP